MNFLDAAINMQKQQLRTNAILNERILNLFETIKRHDFVPETYINTAYSDFRIPLPHQQCMLTPSEEGKILQALQLQSHETVLEIGTGSGFFTAMLSRLVKEVISIEYFADMTQMAQKKLDAYQINNVTLITADASQGYLDKAPYDVIVVSGAIEKISDLFKLQVFPGGRFFAIVGTAPVMRGVLLTLSHDNQWSEEILFQTYTPALIQPAQKQTFVFGE